MIRLQKRPSLNKSRSFNKSSDIKDIPAFSTASALPDIPIAIPTCAVARAGLLFVPSPTTAT